MKEAKINKDYSSLLEELKSIILKGKNNVYKAVDNILVETRWQMGERIVREELKYQDKAEYGEYLIKNLVIDLGIKKQRLSEVIKFYKYYPIVRSLSGQLSWKHYTILIQVTNQKERNFYEIKAAKHSWSYRELAQQIKNKLYQNTDQKELTNIQKVTTPVAVDIQKIFKPEYDLNFLDIIPNHQEKELEDKIVLNIESFLREMGSDFMFLGRQVPTLIDNQKHFIDLVFFHRSIPCVILVDLKVGKFDSRDIGQMNKYINYFRNNRQYAYEQDAIGLIICREAGHEEVFYALGGLEDKIFIAKYKTKLPSTAKIKRIIKEI